MLYKSECLTKLSISVLVHSWSRSRWRLWRASEKVFHGLLDTHNFTISKVRRWSIIPFSNCNPMQTSFNHFLQVECRPTQLGVCVCRQSTTFHHWLPSQLAIDGWIVIDIKALAEDLEVASEILVQDCREISTNEAILPQQPLCAMWFVNILIQILHRSRLARSGLSWNLERTVLKNGRIQPILELICSERSLWSQDTESNGKRFHALLKYESVLCPCR